MALEVEKKRWNDAVVIRQLAEVYKSWGDMDKVLRMYERLVELEPMDPEYRISLGHFYWMRGMRSKADAMFRSVVEKHLYPQESEGYFAVAQAYFLVRRYKKALRYVSAAIKKSGKARYHLFLADVLERMRSPIEKIEKALSNAFKAAHSKGNVPMVRKVRKRLLKLWDKFGVLHSRLESLERRWQGQLDEGMFIATGYIRAQDYPAAERMLVNLHKRYPRLGEPLAGLLRLYADWGNYHRLLEVFPAAIKAMPERKGEFYELAAYAWAELGDIRKSRRYLRMSLSEGRDDPQALVNGARLSVRLGDFSEALASYRKAINLAPYEMQYRFEMARLLEKMGRIEQAIVTYYTIMRRGHDEDAADAIKAALVLENMTGRTGRLEKILHALAFEHPNRKVFMTWLGRLYEMQTPLFYIYSDRYSSEERKALQVRALQPLLDRFMKSETIAERIRIVRYFRMLHSVEAAEPLLHHLKAMVTTGKYNDAERVQMERLIVEVAGLSSETGGGTKALISILRRVGHENQLSRLLRIHAAVLLAAQAPGKVMGLERSPSLEERKVAYYVMARKKPARLARLIEKNRIPPELRTFALMVYGLARGSTAVMDITGGKTGPQEMVGVFSVVPWTGRPESLLETYLIYGTGLSALRLWAFGKATVSGLKIVRKEQYLPNRKASGYWTVVLAGASGRVRMSAQAERRLVRLLDRMVPKLLTSGKGIVSPVLANGILLRATALSGGWLHASAGISDAVARCLETALKYPDRWRYAPAVWAALLVSRKTRTAALETVSGMNSVTRTEIWSSLVAMGGSLSTSQTQQLLSGGKMSLMERTLVYRLAMKGRAYSSSELKKMALSQDPAVAASALMELAGHGALSAAFVRRVCTHGDPAAVKYLRTLGHLKCPSPKNVISGGN